MAGPDYNPLDPEQEDPNLQSIYRKRNLSGGMPAPQAPSTSGNTPDTRTMSLAPRQAEGQDPTRQAPSSFDESQIYKPRYVDVPNDTWSQIARAARPGSVLGLIGAASGGSSQNAIAHNAMEHQKYQESLELLKAKMDAGRWDAYEKNQQSQADERGKPKETWQDRFRVEDPEGFAKYTDHSKPDPSSLVPPHLAEYEWANPLQEGEDPVKHKKMILKMWQDDQAKARTENHPVRTGSGSPKILYDRDTNQSYQFVDGELQPVKTPDGHAVTTSPGKANGPNVNLNNKNAVDIAAIDNAIDLTNTVLSRAKVIAARHGEGTMGNIASKLDGLSNRAQYSVMGGTGDKEYQDLIPAVEAAKAIVTGPLMKSSGRSLRVWNAVQQHLPNSTDAAPFMVQKAQFLDSLLRNARMRQAAAAGLPQRKGDSELPVVPGLDQSEIDKFFLGDPADGGSAPTAQGGHVTSPGGRPPLSSFEKK